MSVTPSTVSSMYELAVDYLNAIVAAMTSTEAGAPARAFVSPGPPAWDTQCDQACVFIPSLTEEQTSPTSPAPVTGFRHRYGRVNLVGLVGYAVRCAAVSEGSGDPYSPLLDVTLNAQAKKVYEDGWAVSETVLTLIRSGDLFGGSCGDVHFDPASPIPQQGGLTGWQFPIRVELNGYVPDVVFPPVGLAA